MALMTRCNRGARPPRVTRPPGRYALGRRVPPWLRASPLNPTESFLVAYALCRLDDRSEESRELYRIVSNVSSCVFTVVFRKRSLTVVAVSGQSMVRKLEYKGQ